MEICIKQCYKLYIYIHKKPLKYIVQLNMPSLNETEPKKRDEISVKSKTK